MIKKISLLSTFLIVVLLLTNLIFAKKFYTSVLKVNLGINAHKTTFDKGLSTSYGFIENPDDLVKYINIMFKDTVSLSSPNKSRLILIKTTCKNNEICNDRLKLIKALIIERHNKMNKMNKMNKKLFNIDKNINLEKIINSKVFNLDGSLDIIDIEKYFNFILYSEKVNIFLNTETSTTFEKIFNYTKNKEFNLLNTLISILLTIILICISILKFRERKL